MDNLEFRQLVEEVEAKLQLTEEEKEAMQAGFRFHQRKRKVSWKQSI